MKQGYQINQICWCVYFIKKYELNFIIIVVYVDDSNLIESLEKLSKVVRFIKMKDLGKTKLCICLQIEHLVNRIHFYQLYKKKSLKTSLHG